MKNKFITFEGPEGSGKTSVIQEVYKALKDLGYDVIVTREPGGVTISERIRSLLLDYQDESMDQRTEALLFAASRRQHVIEIIKPALESGKIVLCDRYIDSSLAYQGVARGLGIEEVYHLNLFAIETYIPDLTLFIDIAPETGLKRVKKNQRAMNRLDLETLDFHQKVYEGYQTLLGIEPDRIKRIDGNTTIEEVSKQAIQMILKEN
jgi:dTMP kinase